MRQPNVRAITGTIRGVTMAPTLAPALKRPMAKVRSLRGNHSATAARAEGKVPASPSARGMRTRAKPAVEVTRACAMCPTVQSPTATT